MRDNDKRMHVLIEKLHPRDHNGIMLACVKVIHASTCLSKSLCPRGHAEIQMVRHVSNTALDTPTYALRKDNRMHVRPDRIHAISRILICKVISPARSLTLHVRNMHGGTSIHCRENSSADPLGRCDPASSNCQQHEAPNAAINGPRE